MPEYSDATAWVAELNGWAKVRLPADLGTACCAILGLAATGELGSVPSASRDAWGRALQAAQLHGTEFFADPATDLAEAARLSQLALQALDALGQGPTNWPEATLREAPDAWLTALDWSQPLTASAVAAQRLQWLALQAEWEADRDALTRFRAALTWLDEAQAYATGLWGTEQGASIDDALLAAPPLLVFFEYVRSPVRHASQRLDLALERLAQGHLPGLAGAEAAAGLAWLLAASHRQFDYRRTDIGAALDSLVAGLPADTATQRQWEGARTGWLANLTRALAAHTRKPQSASWQFARRPGPGCFPHPELSPHEREALPFWIGRGNSAQGGGEPPAAPAVTVVIPVFNLGRYLPEAVESVLAQTYQGFELIVIDDGSTDEFTRLLLDSWPYPRARVLRQANQGVATARNRGIAAGTGRYICCLDADDRLRPRYFERAVAVLESDPAVGFVSGQMQMFDGAEALVAPVECALPGLLAQNQAFEPALFRRSAWQAAGGYYTGFSVSGIEDWDLWISFLGLGLRCAVLPEVIFDYRILPSSMTSRMHEPECWAALVGELVGRHAALYQEHLVAVLTQNAFRIAELRAWSNSREQARAWWERQAKTWQQNTERLETLLAAQIDWTRQLQEGKDWLEQQLRAHSRPPEHNHD